MIGIANYLKFSEYSGAHYRISRIRVGFVEKDARANVVELCYIKKQNNQINLDNDFFMVAL